MKEEIRKTYYENGNIETERTFVDGVEHGPAKGWFESGQLEFEAFKENGLVQGLVKNYYENGNLRIENNFIDQVKEGEEKLYYDTGQLAELNNYQNNQLNGLVEFYSEEGDLTDKVKYINGEISFDQNELNEISFQDFLGKFHSYDFSNLINEEFQEVEINWIQDLGSIYNRIEDKPLPYVIFHNPKTEDYNESLCIFALKDACNPELIIDQIIKNNGGNSNFTKIDDDEDDEYNYCFNGHLFWLGYLERESDFIIEINRIKHEWFSADGRAILYGINKDSKKINSIIKGLDSLVYNNGEMASGDGRLCVTEITPNPTCRMVSYWSDPKRLIKRFKNIAKNYQENIYMSVDFSDFGGKLSKYADLNETELVKYLDDEEFNMQIKTKDFVISVSKGTSSYQMNINILTI